MRTKKRIKLRRVVEIAKDDGDDDDNESERVC